MREVETKLNETMRNEKLLEVRLRLQAEEKDKIERNVKEKYSK